MIVPCCIWNYFEENLSFTHAKSPSIEIKTHTSYTWRTALSWKVESKCFIGWCGHHIMWRLSSLFLVVGWRGGAGAFWRRKGPLPAEQSKETRTSRLTAMTFIIMQINLSLSSLTCSPLYGSFALLEFISFIVSIPKHYVCICMSRETQICMYFWSEVMGTTELCCTQIKQFNDNDIFGWFQNHCWVDIFLVFICSHVKSSPY